MRNIQLKMSVSVRLSLQGADCGEGVSRREMSCVVHWGSLSGPPQPVPVEDQWCVVHSQSKVSEIELQQPCTIPCPGLHLRHIWTQYLNNVMYCWWRYLRKILQLELNTFVFTSSLWLWFSISYVRRMSPDPMVPVEFMSAAVFGWPEFWDVGSTGSF